WLRRRTPGSCGGPCSWHRSLDRARRAEHLHGVLVEAVVGYHVHVARQRANTKCERVLYGPVEQVLASPVDVRTHHVERHRLVGTCPSRAQEVLCERLHLRVLQRVARGQHAVDRDERCPCRKRLGQNVTDLETVARPCALRPLHQWRTDVHPEVSRHPWAEALLQEGNRQAWAAA